MIRAQTIYAAVLCAAIGGCGSDSTAAPDKDPGVDAGAGDPGVLEPPSNVHVEPGLGSRAYTLTWTAPAQPVDGYEITTTAHGWAFSDGDTHGGIAPGITTQAELDFSQSSLRELTPIHIQIRSRHHGTLSAFAPAVTCTIPVSAPLDDGPVVLSNGISLSWFNYSQIATAVDIERAPLDASGAPGAWSSIATVPPANSGMFLDQTYVDTTAIAVGTAYAYRLDAIAASGDRGTGEVVTTPARGPALAELTLQLPPAIAPVTDGNGHFAFYSQGLGGIRFTWGNGSPWQQSPMISAAAYPPFVRLDAAGLPHAVYVTAANVLTHGWSDGTQWHEETITEAPLAAISVQQLQFDLDATGAPVVLWMPIFDHFSVATKAAGSWTVASLDALVGPNPLGPAGVLSDGTGVAHIMVSTLFGVRHLQRSGATWTSELVPGILPIDGPMLAAGHDPDHLIVCVDDFGLGGLTIPLCVRKTPAGWGAVERLGILPESIVSGSLSAQIAMSGDGQQLAVLYQLDGSEAQLFRATAAGTWTETVLPATPAAAFLGFSPTNQLFTLADLTENSDAGQAAVAYRFSLAP